jgi:putative hemolysin
MNPFQQIIAAASAALLLACGGGSASDDERGAVGVPNGAADYCTRLGFTLVSDGRCQFPDGSSCEEWAFYRAQCGQPHSFCERHGGTISSQTEDAGTWTSVVAVCSLNGKQCTEASFMGTGTCG